MPFADKEQFRAYQREWVRKRREKWFADKSCVECGALDQLELDHINPDHKISHRIWTWAWKRILEETAKCQVLCKSCHQAKTLRNKEYACGEQVHGALLNGEIVLRMRKDYSSGNVTFKELESKYNIKAETIRYAVNRGWKHLGGLPESGLSGLS